MTVAPAVPRERVLALPGARNLRDLGGYRTRDGRRVRWGLLFRSGSIGGLTRADWDHLHARGVRTLCDFRSSRERAHEPFAFADTDGISYYTRDYETSFADLRSTLASGLATGESARAAMLAGYRTLPFKQAPDYARLFAHLKAGDVPILFNCSAGKDRAGTAAALILSALGVARSDVLADYALTDTVVDLARVLAERSGGKPGSMASYPADVGAAVLRADPDYMNTALDAIDAAHGSVEAYLADRLDIDADALATIRDRLLEPEGDI